MVIDRQKLNNQYIFTGRGTVAELVAEIDQIVILEKKLKAEVSFIRWLALAVFLLLAAAAVTVGGFLIVLGVLEAIGLLIYSGVVAASRIIRDRVEFLHLILNMLSQDSDQRGRFRVLLRLRSKPEKISEGPDPRYGSGKQNLLRDPWLSLSGRLSDGTSISASCADLIRKRTRKNFRGKTKTRERRACLLRVQLDYKSGRYGDVAIAVRRLANPFRLPDGVRMKLFSSTGEALAMKTIVKGNPAAAALHAASEAMLLGAYRILNLARKRVRASGGAK